MKKKERRERERDEALVAASLRLVKSVSIKIRITKK